MTFDPANRVIPFPNDVLRTGPKGTVALPNPRTGRPLTAADCQTTDTSIQLVCGLNTLDGFSTLVSPISENSDTAGALEQGTIDAKSLDARTVGLVPLKSDAPSAERTTPKYTPCLNCLSSRDAMGGREGSRSRVGCANDRPCKSTRYLLYEIALVLELPTVVALLDARAGDAKAVLRALERLGCESVMQTPIRRTELYGGAAGLACAALGLEQRLGAMLAPEARVILGRILQRARKSLEEAHFGRGARAAPELLGMAHGFAGELWALSALRGPEHEATRARLDELAALRDHDVNGLLFWHPARGARDTSYVATWCHGMTGHSLLWSEVARRSSSRPFARLARRAAESVAVLRAGTPTLCCGLAGQSIALQRYADLSGDEACQFAASCRHLKADFRRVMPPRHLQAHAATSTRA